jgi:hypothetical protein
MKPNWLSFMSSNPGSMAMLLTNATFFQNLFLLLQSIHCRKLGDKLQTCAKLEFSTHSKNYTTITAQIGLIAQFPSLLSHHMKNARKINCCPWLVTV